MSEPAIPAEALPPHALTRTNVAVLTVPESQLEQLRDQVGGESQMVVLTAEELRTLDEPGLKARLLELILPGHNDPEAELKVLQGKLLKYIVLRQLQVLGVDTLPGLAYAELHAESIGFRSEKRGVSDQQLMRQFVRQFGDMDIKHLSQGLAEEYSQLKFKYNLVNEQVQSILAWRRGLPVGRVLPSGEREYILGHCR